MHSRCYVELRCHPLTLNSDYFAYFVICVDSSESNSTSLIFSVRIYIKCFIFKLKQEVELNWETNCS